MSKPTSAELLAAAQTAFAYLSATDPLPAARADAVIGFGTFDVTLASFSGELFAQGRAARIVFTGGFGAGTADLDRPEADAWRDELKRTHPEIGDDRVVVENRSSNTAENIGFTAALLARDHPQLSFGTGLRTVLIVAAPSRLRRVWLTMEHLQPDVATVRCLPPVTFHREYALHQSKGFNFLAHLCGELDRLVAYPSRGWIAHEPLPPAVVAAHDVLRRAP